MKTVESKFPPAKFWDAPFNFITGCTKISPGCKNCWAESIHEARRKALLDHTNNFTNEIYWKPFSEIQYFHEKLAKGIPGGKPKAYFVNNTSDLFHDDVDGAFEDGILEKLLDQPLHRYLILTKRPDTMNAQIQTFCFDRGMETMPDNFWLGITCEDQKRADERIPHLLRTSCPNRWLSLEPLLSGIYLNKMSHGNNLKTKGYFNDPNWQFWLNKLSWVVVGCESGANRRPCKLKWVRSIVDQCQNANVPVFVKQLDLDGKCVRNIEKFPKDLQVRQLPWEVEG